jgi:hypothetical protein
MLPGSVPAQVTTPKQCGPLRIRLAVGLQHMQVLTAGTANCTPVTMDRAAILEVAACTQQGPLVQRVLQPLHVVTTVCVCEVNMWCSMH